MTTRHDYPDLPLRPPRPPRRPLTTADVIAALLFAALAALLLPGDPETDAAVVEEQAARAEAHRSAARP